MRNAFELLDEVSLLNFVKDELLGLRGILESVDVGEIEVGKVDVVVGGVFFGGLGAVEDLLLGEDFVLAVLHDGQVLDGQRRPLQNVRNEVRVVVDDVLLPAHEIERVQKRALVKFFTLKRHYYFIFKTTVFT